VRKKLKSHIPEEEYLRNAIKATNCYTATNSFSVGAIGETGRSAQFASE
jgi:hypothetical protein